MCQTTILTALGEFLICAVCSNALLLLSVGLVVLFLIILAIYSIFDIPLLP